MFSTRYKGVYVPSTHLSNCGKFNDVILNAEATVLENQNGCSLCTLFTHNKKKTMEVRRNVRGSHGQQGMRPRAPPYAAPIV